MFRVVLLNSAIKFVCLCGHCNDGSSCGSYNDSKPRESNAKCDLLCFQLIPVWFGPKNTLMSECAEWSILGVILLSHFLSF